LPVDGLNTHNSRPIFSSTNSRGGPRPKWFPEGLQRVGLGF